MSLSLAEIQQYLWDNYKEHPNIEITQKVLTCVEYIEQNIDNIAQQVIAGNNQVFRHPENHMAVHVHAATEQEFKQQFRHIIEQLKQCFEDFLQIEDIACKKRIINIFLNNIDDSEVGCMEVRLKKAFAFYGLYSSNGGVFSFNDLMQDFFSRHRVIDESIVPKLLNDFSDFITYQLPVEYDDNIVPLTWDLIKDYCKNIMSIEAIDDYWVSYGGKLPNATITPGKKWQYYNFDNESDAIHYLNYVRSLLYNKKLEGFSKVEVKFDDANEVYTFKLSHSQHRCFKHHLLSASVDGGLVPFRDDDINNLTPQEQEDYRQRLRINTPANFPQERFFIKSLRSDNGCYIIEFVAGIIPPNRRSPLRIGKKRRYTVTGKGVFTRNGKDEVNNIEQKKPQYTKEQKSGYSNFQSTTMGTVDFFPKVFGFKKNRDIIGVILHPDNVLLSNRLLIYDTGTVKRPYDFDDLDEAKGYAYDKINDSLFAADAVDDFEQAIKREGRSYNEALVRIKGTADENLRVFINTDNLNARLTAQEYARIIKNRLHQSGLCNEDYQVPIIYYTPDEPTLNFKSYTQAEQQLDYLQARAIVKNKDKFEQWINYEDYGILFAVTPDEISSDENQYIFHELIYNGYIQVFTYLLEKLDASQIKPLLEIKDNDGNTALMLAALKGHTECLNAMLEKLDASQIKPLLEIKNNDDHTALMYAARLGHTECLNAMLKELNANQIKPLLKIKGKDGYIAPMYAACLGHTECLNAMLEKLDASQIKTLLEIKDKHGLTAFMLTATSGHTECLNVMLKELNAEQIKTLLEIKDNDGIIALMYAAYLGHTKCLNAMLKKLDASQIKTLLEIKNNNGRTALMVAALKGHNKCLDAMLEKLDSNQIEALLEIKDDDGMTAFMLALKGHTKCLNAMLEKLDSNQIKALLEIKDKHGMTAFMLAALKGHTECLNAMFKKLDASQIKALLEIKNKLGWTMLKVAAPHGYAECLKAMLKKLDVEILVEFSLSEKYKATIQEIVDNSDAQFSNAFHLLLKLHQKVQQLNNSSESDVLAKKKYDVLNSIVQTIKNKEGCILSLDDYNILATHRRSFHFFGSRTESVKLVEALEKLSYVQLGRDSSPELNALKSNMP